MASIFYGMIPPVVSWLLFCCSKIEDEVIVITFLFLEIEWNPIVFDA